MTTLNTPDPASAAVVDIEKLERLAKESLATWGLSQLSWYTEESLACDLDSVDARFVRALSPTVALALLAELRAHRAAGWVSVSDELPDSDVWVLVANDGGNYSVAELAFTDDSEGHGKPYWAHEGGDTSLEAYPFWTALPAPPKGQEPTEGV